MRLIPRVAHNFSELVISMILAAYACIVFRIIFLPVSSELQVTFSCGTQFAVTNRCFPRIMFKKRRLGENFAH